MCYFHLIDSSTCKWDPGGDTPKEAGKNYIDVVIVSGKFGIKPGEFLGIAPTCCESHYSYITMNIFKSIHRRKGAPRGPIQTLCRKKCDSMCENSIRPPKIL